MNKMDEILSFAKISEFMHRQELEEEKRKTVCLVLAIIAGIIAVAGIAFGIYKFLSRDKDVEDYEDDFEDDFDDFEDDFDEEADFVKEDEAEPAPAKEPEKTEE